MDGTHFLNSLEFKFAPDGELGEIAGYGSTFGGDPDLDGDIVAPGAFTESLSVHAAAGTSPAMLWAHDPARPVGKWNDLRQNNHGLFARGALNMGATAGRDAYAHVKAGDMRGLSIGFTVPPGGRVASGGAKLIQRAHVHEISLVAIPANGRAGITSVKAAGGVQFADAGAFERFLHEHGVARGAARKLASGGWPALAGGDDGSADEAGMKALMARLDRATLDLKNLKG